MANRYWVGGSGNWNYSNTANWSTVSGGGGGASVPSTSDDVIIDQNGPYDISATIPIIVNSISITGTNVSFDVSGGSPTIYLTGSFYTHPTTKLFSYGFGSIEISPPTGTTAYVDINGSPKNIASFNVGTAGSGYSGTVVINSDLSTDLTGMFVSAGGDATLNLNNHTIKAGGFSAYSTVYGKVDFASSSVIEVSADVFIQSGAVIAGTGTIRHTCLTTQTTDIATSVDVSGITLQYAQANATYSLMNTGSSGVANITNTAYPFTINFGNGLKFNNFNLSGAPGNLINIRAYYAPYAATINKTSGTVNASYLDIKDSNASGGATWYSLYSNGNVNSGNNTGWIFGVNCNFFPLFP